MCTLGHLRQGASKCRGIPDRGAMGFRALVSGAENVELSPSLMPRWGWLGRAATRTELQGCSRVEPPWPALGVPYGVSFRFCLAAPPWHPIPRFFSHVGPKARITGVIWRGTPGRPGVTSPTWAGRAWMTLPSSSLPGAAWRQEASLEEPRKLSSAGRGGGSGAHSPLPPVES
jgi:hypothetical protein